MIRTDPRLVGTLIRAQQTVVCESFLVQYLRTNILVFGYDFLHTNIHVGTAWKGLFGHMSVEAIHRKIMLEIMNAVCAIDKHELHCYRKYRKAGFVQLIQSVRLISCKASYRRFPRDTEAVQRGRYTSMRSTVPRAYAAKLSLIACC